MFINEIIEKSDAALEFPIEDGLTLKIVQQPLYGQISDWGQLLFQVGKDYVVYCGAHVELGDAIYRGDWVPDYSEFNEELGEDLKFSLCNKLIKYVFDKMGEAGFQVVWENWGRGHNLLDYTAGPSHRIHGITYYRNENGELVEHEYNWQ